MFKMTTISGFTVGYVRSAGSIMDDADEGYARMANFERCFRSTTRNGHWSPKAAVRLARRMGIVGQIDIVHSTADTSGHGWGGNDAAWVADENDVVSPRPLIEEEQNYDDGQDINDLWDEIEGMED